MSNQILIVSDEDHQREAILRQAARAGFADQEIVVAIDEAWPTTGSKRASSKSRWLTSALTWTKIRATGFESSSAQ